MRHPIRLAAGLVALLLAAAAPACSQARSGDLRTPSLSQAERDSIAARAERSRFRGREDAPVVIYEISDFQCPFCREFTAETYPALDSAYIQTGKVRLVFLPFPIPSHPQAWAAAEGALCAGAQGKFWPMHDLLFQRQEEWSRGGLSQERLEGYAGSLKLDVGAFRTCTLSDAVAPLLVGDLLRISGAGIGGTPTFILNGEHALQGAQPFSEFQRQIDALLAQKK
jgi:protein-disulfide isomerase